jgi:UDP-N-acetylglucosamine 2-epimerase (non-hydrolysing)/GDP/UDP-N,N'-diacetylbacillosamine 2-epimerase (hydrolysing)
MRSVLRRIRATKGLALTIVATGMHLSPEFGSTIKQIERDGFEVSARIPCLRPEDTGGGMLRSFSRFLTRLVDTLEVLNPHILLLLGDRWEMLAGAMAGSYMNIAVAHVHGGEISGSVDEPNRHVITRFAHIHLVAAPEHARVLRKIGEQSSRIHVIGAPGLDDIVSHNYAPADYVAARYGVDRCSSHVLLVQHPVVTESLLAEAQIKATLDAIVRLHYPTTAIYPNADAGGRQMIKVMKRYAERYPFIRLRRNIPREDYLGLMAISSVIVGNSSSGIIEAASFGLPSVNIGSRQLGRTQPANIQNVGCDEREITEAIKLALSTTFRSRLRGLRNPYGDGRTAPRLVRILRQLRITPSFLQKRLEVA